MNAEFIKICAASVRKFAPRGEPFPSVIATCSIEFPLFSGAVQTKTGMELPDGSPVQISAEEGKRHFHEILAFSGEIESTFRNTCSCQTMTVQSQSLPLGEILRHDDQLLKVCIRISQKINLSFS
jgi:hypothetical protein